MAKARNLSVLLAADGQVEDAKIDGLTSSKLTGDLPALSAANLTSIPAANITGTLPAISGANLTGVVAVSGVATDATKLPLAGGAMTGAITTNSTFDGRDVATDGTKLDGIATSANLYVHPNHSGDVVSTADGATVIQVDAVDIAMLSATGTAGSTTFLRGDNQWSTPTNTTYTAGAGIVLTGTSFSAGPIALTTVQVAANQTAQLALTAEEGDVAVRSDEKKSYMHNGGSAGTMADWTELQTPTDSVLSVNGQTGAITVSTIFNLVRGLAVPIPTLPEEFIWRRFANVPAEEFHNDIALELSAPSLVTRIPALEAKEPPPSKLPNLTSPILLLPVVSGLINSITPKSSAAAPCIDNTLEPD